MRYQSRCSTSPEPSNSDGALTVCVLALAIAGLTWLWSDSAGELIRMLALWSLH